MEPQTLGEALHSDELTSLLAIRLRFRMEEIERAAMNQIVEEQHKAAVAARANEIRAYYSKSLWQRLLSKLPFTIQRRKQP